ncbi:zinc finger CW-type PWWP domain protein 1-like [Halyomorpha halys]|uniref:zinc finger CW-type PWWP domain protein 1-like n=1 Tax=Halyomorpha halys TaxID=286706 RepID=UPI0034D37A98
MSGPTECAQEIFNLKIPGQQTQREKIMWMQQNRMNGTWVKCFQCQKWRYLKNIFDPVDIPDKWQCSMNLDNKFNTCEEPQSQFNDEAVVRLKYTAGSLVWVNSNRYSRWPGMVDDDPELAQFYYLNPHEEKRRACMYHVVFIDVDYKNTSRQWFSENDLLAFTWYNSQAVPGKLSRLLESVRIAREALDMNIFQRLQKFGFARLFRGHIFSCGHGKFFNY